MVMEFAFISVDGNGLINATDRATVRSQCMHGVNKRQDSRRSRQSVRRQQKAVDNKTVPDSHKALKREDTPSGMNVKLSSAVYDMILSSTASSLSLACCDSFQSKEILFTYCMLKLQMYPVDHYTDLELIDRKWAECLEQDKAFVHTALFTGSAIQDYALQRPFSTITSMHLHQTLHHLRILLSSSAPQNVRTIAFIILSLCIVASIYGDIKVLNVHMAGLWRLLSARGQSCESFFSPRIMCKRDRLELSAYACGGLKPSLPIGPFSWKPVYRTRLLKSQGGSSSAYHKILGPDSDARLGGVFYDVRYLATEIRDSATTGSQIQGSRFRESFYSVQSRLIHLEDDLGDPWAECLRLGLLACLMANFRVPNRRIAGAQLVQKARDVCRLVTAHTLGQRDLLAWFLMVCVISICEPEDDWVTAKWQPCAPPPETSYAVFKEETLRQVVWIDCVYDEIGIQVFHRLQKSMRTR